MNRNLVVKNFVQRVSDMLPWLQERGWSDAPVNLMLMVNMLLPAHRRQILDKVTQEAEEYDGEEAMLKSWIESRKPGVVLRERPRHMHPAYILDGFLKNKQHRGLAN